MNALIPKTKMLWWPLSSPSRLLTSPSHVWRDCADIWVSGISAPGSSPHYRHNFWLTCRSSPATLRLQGHQSTIHCLPFSHLHHDDIWKVISIVYLYNVRGTVSEYYPDVALSCNVLMDAMITLYHRWSFPYILFIHTWFSSGAQKDQ